MADKNEDLSFLDNLPHDEHSFLNTVPHEPVDTSNPLQPAGLPQQQVLGSHGVEQSPQTPGLDVTSIQNPPGAGRPLPTPQPQVQADPAAAKQLDDVIGQNSTPELTQERSNYRAAGRNILDSALGGFGDNAEALSRNNLQFGQGYNQSLQDIRSQSASDNKNASKGVVLLSTAIGIGINGYLGGKVAEVAGDLAANAAERAASSEVAQTIAPKLLDVAAKVQGQPAADFLANNMGKAFFTNVSRNAAEIGSLAVQGGIDSVGLNNSANFEQAQEDFKRGAKFSFLVGATAKMAPALFSNALSKEAKGSFNYSVEQGQYIANQAPQIGQRVAQLSDQVEQDLQGAVKIAGTAKGTRLQQLSKEGVEVPNLNQPFEKLHSKLADLDGFVGEKDAVNDIREVVNQHEENLLQNGTRNSADIALVDQTKQDLQKEWLKGGSLYKYRETKAFTAFKDFEKDIRDGINKVDPKTGAYNDVIYNFKNAIDENPGTTFYEQSATSPNKPTTIQQKNAFSQHLDEKSFKPETLNNPETALILDRTKKLIDMKVQPAVEDYAILQKVTGSKLEEAVAGKSYTKLIPSAAGIAGRAGQITSLQRFLPEYQKAGLGALMQGIKARLPISTGYVRPQQGALNTITQPDQPFDTNSLNTLK